MSNEEFIFLKEYTLDEVADLFIVSQVEFVDNALETTEIEGITIAVNKANGEKCERCWKYDEKVGTHPEHKDTCPRCSKVLG